MKRFLPICLLFFMAGALMMAVPGFGGILTVKSRTTLTVLSDRVSVEIYALNNGNEPAHDVRAYLHVFGQRFSAAAVGRIGVNQSRTFRFTVPLASNQNGEFPFVGEVVFYDSNRLPYSALSAGTFKLGTVTGSNLSVAAAEMTLTEKGRLSVTITSKDSVPRSVVAGLYLPRALTTHITQKKVRIDPLQTASIDFPVFYRFGIGGATYPVFCTVTYSDKGIAYAAVVQTAVTIRSYQNWFVRTRGYWLAGGIFIVLGWAGALQKAQG